MNLQNVRFHFFLPFAAILAGLVSKNTFSDKRLVEIPFRYCKINLCPTEDFSISPFLVPGLYVLLYFELF